MPVTPPPSLEELQQQLNPSIPPEIDGQMSLQAPQISHPISFSNFVSLESSLIEHIRKQISPPVNTDGGPTLPQGDPLGFVWDVSRPQGNMTLNFDAPVGVSLMANKELYLAEGFGFIYKLTPDGQTATWVENIIQHDVGISRIIDISVAEILINGVTERRINLLGLNIKNGKLDFKVAVLVEINGVISREFSFGKKGKGLGELDYPSHITTDSMGQIYVSDIKRIHRFGIEGSVEGFMRVFPDGGSNHALGGVAFSKHNATDLYVTDKIAHQVLHFSYFDPDVSTAQPSHTWGEEGIEDGQFNQPVDLATDAQNNVYVVDKKNYRIQKFSPTGQFLGKGGALYPKGATSPTLGYLRNPVALTVDPVSYNLFILDSGPYPNTRLLKTEPLINVTTSPGPSGREPRPFSIDTIDFRSLRWSQTLKRLEMEHHTATEIHTLAKAKVEAIILGSQDSDSMTAAKNNLAEVEKNTNHAAELLESFRHFLRMQGHRQSQDQLYAMLLKDYRAQVQKYKRLDQDINHSGAQVDVRKYSSVEGSYVDQYGISLVEHVQTFDTLADHQRDNILIIPQEEEDGPNSELSNRYLVVVNPVFGGDSLYPASVLFEEKFSMDVVWSGIGLGELSHTVNLLPGEQRNLKLSSTKKRSLKIVREQTKVTKSGRVVDSKTSSKRQDNFESRLQDAFDSKQDKSQSRSYEGTSTSSMDLSAGFTIKGITADFGSKQNSSRTIKSGGSSSLSSVSKSMSDITNKTALDVSQNNKVSVSSSSEENATSQREEMQEDTETEKTTITLSNINEGKTVNYNFYQVTNRYATSLRSEDLRLHVDTGIELIAGTGLTLSKVYEVEDYGRILNDFDIFPIDKDPRQDMVRAISADLLDRYIAIGTRDDSETSPKIIWTRDILHEQLRDWRQQVQDALDPMNTDASNILFDETHTSGLATILSDFSRARFSIRPFNVGEDALYNINTGKYFVDTQLGHQPATEAYLEIRRAIETERQKAQVEDLDSRIQSGIFPPKFPEDLTTLATDKEQISQDTSTQSPDGVEA